MQLVTEQTSSEHLYLLQSKEGERNVCHYILVPYDKMAILKRYERGENVRIGNCYRHIEYRDDKGKVRRASHYGSNPPENLARWIKEQYGPAAISEDATLVYVKDDIRLCTMQRSALDHLVGLTHQYHNHEHFYYVESLEDESGSTLAMRAGVKRFDRIIECNGMNIEGDSEDELFERISRFRDVIVQLLVCSPATYAHYKSKNKDINSNLETVKIMKPVNDKIAAAASSGNERVQSGDYCAVRWEDESGVSVVNQSSVRKPPDSIGLFELRRVERDGRYCNGQIILKGSKSDCELLRQKNRKVDPNTNVPVNRGNDNKPKPDASPPTHVVDKNQSLAKKGNKSDVNADTHNVPCDGCNSSRIQSDRYRCLQCTEYDLCGECFEKRRETEYHKSGHVYVHFRMPMELFGDTITDVNDEVTLFNLKQRFARTEHTDVPCDGCGRVPIVGIRCKCDTCYNYDLCWTCVENKVVTKQHATTHPLVVVDKNCLNEIEMNDLKLGDVLGKGGFGTVYKARWLSKNRQVACKVLTMPPGQQHLYESFLRELEAYTELSGAYILKLYGYALQQPTHSGGMHKFALITEFMSRGSLTDVIEGEKRLSLRRKLDMASQVAMGMRKLHARHMIHRDIRPDNILVNDNYTAKIGDMGIARAGAVNESQKLTMIGCPVYMPREFYKGKYGLSLDVYTFGLTLYYLFTETRHCYDEVTKRAFLQKESPVFNELIARCIDDRPRQRPSAVEIEITLNLYRRALDKFIKTKYPNYKQMSTEDIDRVFFEFYQKFHPKAKETLEAQFSTSDSLSDDDEDEDEEDQYIAIDPDDLAFLLLRHIMQLSIDEEE